MSRSIRIATWNINSVRLRIAQVCRFLTDHTPDVLCLQETKCPNGVFPTAAFRDIGYEHIEINGQPGYNGVAIVSRLPFATTMAQSFCDKNDARHICVSLSGAPQFNIHNLYIPAGGDEPDPVINEKFAHKLQFLDELDIWLQQQLITHNGPTVLTGDFNIAPHENDVWSHKQLLKVVSHTPVEVARLNAMKSNGEWCDIMRNLSADDEKLYTWWSYRSRDWQVSNRGRRLDHIWIDQAHAATSTSFDIISQTRDWTRPSDHVPVIATFNL